MQLRSPRLNLVSHLCGFCLESCGVNLQQIACVYVYLPAFPGFSYSSGFLAAHRTIYSYVIVSCRLASSDSRGAFKHPQQSEFPSIAWLWPPKQQFFFPPSENHLPTTPHSGRTRSVRGCSNVVTPCRGFNRQIIQMQSSPVDQYFTHYKLWSFQIFGRCENEPVVMPHWRVIPLPGWGHLPSPGVCSNLWDHLIFLTLCLSPMPLP